MSRFEVQFVDRNREALIQRVTSVMPIADELKDRNMINDEKYAEFNAEKNYQGKMRVLFEALDSGGDRVKIEFYYTLKLYQPFLFKDLGGVTAENEWELNDEKAASYVDKHRSELIQRVQRVMAVTRKLLTMNMINVETYSTIWRAGNKQDRMRTLYVALDEGGNEVKSAFHSALKECESHLCYLDSIRFTSHPSFLICRDYLERTYNRIFDSNRSELIQRVTAVIPIVDELLKQHKLNDQTFAQIRREPTNQEQMTKLYKALDKGRHQLKSAFYYALRKYEPHLLCYLENKPSILQYKSSVIDSCKFVTEYNLPSNECVELNRRYTEPVIIQRSKEQNEKYYREHLRSVDASCQQLSNDKNHSVTLDRLFSPDSDGNTPKTVILTGDSGRGKSFTLQKIMLDWATGKLYSENFDVIFLLKSDELKFITEEKSLSELLSWSCSLTSNQTSQILELIPDKILILIDGIDDFSFDPHIQISQSHKALPMDLVMGLLNGRILSESFLLVTLRTAADAVMNHLKGPLRFTEIVGFSERGVQEYFQKFVQGEQLFGKTYECVKTNESLLTTCSVPLLCWMVCFCLKKHFKDNDHVMPELKTTTSIYVHFVSTLLEHHGQSQSVLTMLRSLGQLAEEGILDEEVLFDIKTVLETFEGQNDQFLHEELWIRECRTIRVHKFMHLSFQEFFVALYYVFLNEETSQRNIRDTLAAERVKGRLSSPISSVLLFLCGLSNEDASSSLFKMHNWTVPYIIRKEMESIILTLLDEDQLFALRCLYERHDEEFVRRALGDRVSMDLCNISLRSTDCWVLLYCLQCCPHIRGLNLMYCDLTADKLKILQPALCMCETLRVQEDEYSAESSRWSLDLSVICENVFLSLSSSEKNPSFPAVLNISLTCSHSGISSIDWTLFLQTLSKAGKLAEDSSPLEDYVSLLLSSFHTVGLKTLDLKLFSLNESWASGIISLVQTCTTLQQLSVCGGLLLEEGLVSLKESLSDPHCTVIIEGWKCSKPTEQCTEEDLSQNCNEKVKIHFKPNILLNITEPSALDLHPLPVCRSCVHIADCDQWVQVEPSVSTDEGRSKFRISTRAGRFECSRTRMRWVCAGDVTLQYREVDERFLSAELESLQCERIGPVIDVTVISGKLEEAHLPHYACLAESDPSLKDAVKLLSVENEGITLESVELTRFHARILQPYFSPKTVLMKLGISVKVHCDLLVFMTKNNPIILHVYFFPSDSVVAKKIKTEEKLSHQIKCSRPETPLQMMKQHSLDVPGASVQPKEIKLRGDFKPNFFQVRQSVVDDINMTLSRVNDQKSVWTATIWKELTNISSNKAESSCFLNVQKHETPQVAVHFDKAQFFDRNWCDFIKIVKNVKAVADKLLQKQIIHEEIYSEITHPNSTSEESMRKICSIVRKGNVAVKNFLISVLLEENPNLLNQLPLSDS